MRVWWIAILTAGAASGQWPTPKTALEAYDFVNEKREAARKIWEKGDPKGIDLLKETLPYLEQPLVRDLSAGNVYLAGRRLNIYMDLAEAYAIQHKTRESLDYIRKVLVLRPNISVAKFMEGQKGFESLLANPEFRQLMQEFRQFERLWESPALNTPYRENLSDAEKLAGLGKFWSEIKYNFGYPEKLLAINWDQLYLDWIPKVTATKSTAAYYQELLRLCALLGDGHTNVSPPAQIDNSSKPQIRTGLVEGHVMILEVMSPALEGQGVRAGMEITAVDGEPAAIYARRDVEPYQSASTPQNREIRTFWFGFLQGPRQKPVTLTLRDASGSEVTKEISRRPDPNFRRHAPLEWRLLPNGIAYGSLNSFESDETVAQWRAALPRIAESRALILDVRLNGGGSSGVGYEVLRDLVDKPFAGSREVMRQYNPTERAWGDVMSWKELPAETFEPRGKNPYSKPVVVLAGAATFSAAEDFLVAWNNSGRGKTIGEPTGGSTGQPLPFKLPGGGSARVCTKRDTFPDGTEWVGKGIDPDILVKPTLDDIRAGRDTVLERAQAYLASAAR